MGLPTKIHVVNPKAQSVAELYGELDPETRDWTDGLLSNIFRDVDRTAARRTRTRRGTSSSTATSTRCGSRT